MNLKGKEKLMSVFESVKIGNVVDKFRLLLVTNLNLEEHWYEYSTVSGHG